MPAEKPREKRPEPERADEIRPGGAGEEAAPDIPGAQCLPHAPEKTGGQHKCERGDTGGNRLDPCSVHVASLFEKPVMLEQADVQVAEGVHDQRTDDERHEYLRGTE